MLRPDPLEMSLKGGMHGRGKERYPVSVPLAAPHHDLPRGEVEVFYPQPGTLEEAQAGPVEEEGEASRERRPSTVAARMAGHYRRAERDDTTAAGDQYR